MKALSIGLAALAVFGVSGSTLAAENVRIDFKQIRGPRPQAPLVVLDADMTPLAHKQLDRILTEGGMLEVANFKQEAGMSATSAVWEMKISANGKAHAARIDEQQAPAAYLKLVKFVMKYGHKPADAETAKAEGSDAAVATAKPEAAAKPETAAKPQAAATEKEAADSTATSSSASVSDTK